jgi:hypothetical protein
MRARLRKYLPVFLIAVLVQILAPISASWAAAVAASDPLSVAAICHANGFGADQSGDQKRRTSQSSAAVPTHRRAPRHFLPEQSLELADAVTPRR